MLAFFDAVSFKASFFNFLYNSLSTWSVDFLNFLKSLFLRFNFSNTSPSNHFWLRNNLFPGSTGEAKDVVLEVYTCFEDTTLQFLRNLFYQQRICCTCFWYMANNTCIYIDWFRGCTSKVVNKSKWKYISQIFQNSCLKHYIKVGYKTALFKYLIISLRESNFLLYWSIIS